MATPELNLAQLCQHACEAAQHAAAFIQAKVDTITHDQIEVKDKNSLVSFVDKTAERMLVERLKPLIPEVGFLTEEDATEDVEAPTRWIIDPLDGTTNFLHGIPVFSVSIGLEHKGEIVMGVVHEVMRQETFYAWKGGGAFLNGKPIQVTQTQTLEASILATGFPYYDYSKIESYFVVLEDFMRNSRGLRRMGSAAVDLAYTACGRFDGFFEYGLNAWDVAGGVIILKEAGGQVSDFTGGEGYLFNRQLVASNGHIHPPFLERVAKAFA